VLEVDIVHPGKRMDDLYMLSSSFSYAEKMCSHQNASLWHTRLRKGLPNISSFGGVKFARFVKISLSLKVPLS
jgi:hypothetical protein